MQTTLSFAEYAAVNGLRDVGPNGFGLLSNARLAGIGHNRSWVLDGARGSFEALLTDINKARGRALSAHIGGALASVAKGIGDLLQGARVSACGAAS